MPKFMMLPVLLCIGQALAAQYVYTIKADSVKITNSCDTAELIIENHTQTVPGFLYNKGRGRTEFRRGAIAINDSLYRIGDDTINLYKGRVSVTASNGLNATDGHVKMGGALTDQFTDLKFQFGPDEYYKQFKILSHDENSRLQIQEDYYGEGEPSQTFLIFDSWTPESSGGFSSAAGGFYAYSARSGSVQKAFSIDSTGSHVLNGSMTVGFATPYAHYSQGRALLQIAAGNSTAGSAPLKFTPGTLLTTIENNAVEYDGYDLFLTEHSVRYKLSKTLQGQLTTSFGGPSLSAFNSVTTSLTVSGAQPGDVVNVSSNSGAVNPPSIIITAYVTSANTITLQAYNASNSAVTIASDTYKVRVIK